MRWDIEKRIVQFLLVLLFLALLYIVGKQGEPYETEEISKVKDVYVVDMPTEISEEEILESVADENETILIEKMQNINEKYEIVKSLVPDDYEQLEALDQEILKLNETIGTNTRSISMTRDIHESTLKSLDEVDSALDMIIQVFSNMEETAE